MDMEQSNIFTDQCYMQNTVLSIVGGQVIDKKEYKLYSVGA
jgi:hypothetical protein